MAQIGLEGGLFMNLLVSRKKLLGNTGDFLWSYGGYLIVSALCDLCGVVLDESNARNFTIDCIESLHDTLKDNLSIDRANYILSLNNEIISKFIDFYLSVGTRKQYLYNQGDECTSITGGWERKTNQYTSSYPNDYFKKEDSFMQLYTKRGTHNIQFGTVNKVNISYYAKIFFEIEKIQCPNGVLLYIEFVDTYSPNVWSSKNYKKNNSVFNYDDIFTISMDIKDTFEYKNGYIGIFTDGYVDNLKFNIRKIWLGKKYDIGDSYVKTLEEYKAKYENEPSRIILDSSIVNIKTKWKKESTDIYIPHGNVENLPNGVSLSYALYLFKEGNQCTSITGGWKDYYLSGAQFTDTCILLSQSETHNMFAGTVNEIDFSKYTRMYLDMESTNYCYLLNQTALSAESTWFHWDYSQGTNRKIVSFNLEDKKISTIIYCAIFNPGTAKIYNIWLE